ncbi:hypothetical protein J4434_04215 [Candidatus Woesearchaeota archaeon]|nr:hypothetical protein [Candidatus Woesearchaeota archaeon]
MKFEIEETDIEETDTKEKEINEDIDEVDEIREDNEKPASFCDDVKNEIDDSIYSEEGSSAWKAKLSNFSGISDSRDIQKCKIMFDYFALLVYMDE